MHRRSNAAGLSPRAVGSTLSDRDSKIGLKLARERTGSFWPKAGDLTKSC
jgi:hypothetical protein